MRIGFCIAKNAAIGAIPVLDIIRGIEFSGHNCRVIATSQDGSIPLSHYIQATSSQLRDKNWWARQDLQVVFVYSLHFPIEAAVAAKRAGAVVILDCDSDGRISPILWPFHHWRRYRDETHTIITKARVAKLWLRDILSSRQYETSYLTLLRNVDLIRIESLPAARNLIKLAQYRSLYEIEDKICVVPFCAPAGVCEVEIPVEKTRRVIIAGRLNSPQKNPSALANIIKQLCAEIPDVKFDCFSRGDCLTIRSLVDRFSNRVLYSVDAKKEQVRDALRSARILLSASRWETLPIIGIEALCMGCTIVAPPLDGYMELCESGRFGTVAQSFSSFEICRAFHSEWKHWELSRRDGQFISRSARERYSPENVGSRLVELCGRKAKSNNPPSEASSL